MKPVAPGHTALAQDRIQTLPIQTEPGFHPPSKPFQSSCSGQRQLPVDHCSLRRLSKTWGLHRPLWRQTGSIHNPLALYISCGRVGTSVGLLVGQFTHWRNNCAETRILDVQQERKQRGKDPRPGTQEVLPKCWLLSQGFLMWPPWRHQDARPPVPSAGSELPATSTRAPPPPAASAIAVRPPPEFPAPDHGSRGPVSLELSPMSAWRGPSVLPPLVGRKPGLINSLTALNSPQNH